VNNLGNVAQRTADPDEARDRYEEAADIWAEALGPEHPDAVIPLANLANIRARNGKIAEGRTMAEHVLDVWKRAHGPNHSRLTIPLHTLAETSRDLEDWPAAVEYDKQALAIYRATMPADHPSHGGPTYGLGMTHYWQGKWDDAMTYFERTLEIYEKAYGPEHPRLCLTLAKLALTELERDPNAALPHAERALAIAEKAYDDNNPSIARLTYTKATVLMSLERWEDAIPDLKRTIELRPGPTKYHPDEIGGPRFELAQAYDKLGQHESEIAELTNEAARLYEEWGLPGPAAEMRAWLATRNNPS